MGVSTTYYIEKINELYQGLDKLLQSGSHENQCKKVTHREE